MPERNKKIYICSPLRGDMEKNIQKAIHYCREAIRTNPEAVPIAPHIYCTQFLDDNVPSERAAGLDMGISLLDACSEIWVYGIDNPSEGMKAEIQYAKCHGIKIIPKEPLLDIPRPKREIPTPDPARVQFWKDAYLALNQTCPELYGESHLIRRFHELQSQESEFDTKSDYERTDYYACIKGLKSAIDDLSA